MSVHSVISAVGRTLRPKQCSTLTFSTASLLASRHEILLAQKDVKVARSRISFCIWERHQGNGASSGLAFNRRASFALRCPFDLAWLLRVSDSILKLLHPVTKLEPEFDRLGHYAFIAKHFAVAI